MEYLDESGIQIPLVQVGSEYSGDPNTGTIQIPDNLEFNNQKYSNGLY